MDEAEEVVTSIRLETKTKYFAQLIARGAGMSLAGLVQALLDDYLSREIVRGTGEEISMTQLMSEVWAEHEADRMVLIADRFPRMLTERERVLWKRIICERQEFWHAPLSHTRHRVTLKTFNFPHLREQWGALNKEADALDRPRSEVNKDWSIRAIAQQRALIQKQELINEVDLIPARKGRRKE